MGGGKEIAKQRESEKLRERVWAIESEIRESSESWMNKCWQRI
jgi:hypothetical protein